MYVEKIKEYISSKEHYQLYPTDSFPGKFYGTEKIHNLPPNGLIENLPLRPIVSNIGTASYQLAEYLANLLSSLVQLNYTINSTKDLMIKIKNEKFPENYKMVSFDVKSLFTSVSI